MKEIIFVLIYLAIGSMFVLGLTDADKGKFWAKLFCLLCWPFIFLLLLYASIYGAINGINTTIKRKRGKVDNSVNNVDDNKDAKNT